MKTQTLFKSIFGVAVIAVLLPVVSCDAANNPSALTGRWVEESGKNIWELLSDGTVITNENQIRSFTWKAENGRFYIHYYMRVIDFFREITEVYNYKVQGSTLTLTDDKDEVVLKYKKCSKNCQEVAKEYAEAAKTAVLDSIAKAEAPIIADFKAKGEKAPKGSFTDARDGKTYKTVKLDNQTWMAENLNYNANDSECYGDNESNCHWRFYDRATALKACPIGWHLPSHAEWKTLFDLAGGCHFAGQILSSQSKSWNDYKGIPRNGVDAFGFSAISSGSSWWSSDGNNSKFPSRPMLCISISVCSYKDKSSNKLSVRCIQD